MILLVKRDTDLSWFTFKMASDSKELDYIDKFNNLSDDAILNLGKMGNYKKDDVVLLKYVKSQVDAQQWMKGFIKFVQQQTFKNMVVRDAETISPGEKSTYQIPSSTGSSE